MAFIDEDIVNTRTESSALLHLAQAGDRSAASALLEPHRTIVFNYFRNRVRTYYDAEDLTQDVLIRAATAISAYDRKGTISSWMIGIAANLLKNYYSRALSKQDKVDSLDALPEEMSFEVKRTSDSACPYKLTDSRDYVHELLAALRDSQVSHVERAVILLVYQQESYEDIGLLLKIRQGAARLHFLRGREKLLAYLVEYNPELLGGKDAILAAWEAACHASEATSQPTTQERQAWSAPHGRAKTFRSAVVKMARYLPLPVTVLMWLAGTSL